MPTTKAITPSEKPSVSRAIMQPPHFASVKVSVGNRKSRRRRLL
ncbi:hypothetical protein [Streptomyces sp. NPDC048419]